MARKTDLSAEFMREMAADPYLALSNFAEVHDQKTGQPVRYRHDRVTKRLQATILRYITDPPRTGDGQTRFLDISKSRQTGGSLVGEIAVLPKVYYTEGWVHHCICDTDDRAGTLHARVQYTHNRWPEHVRQKQKSTNETRQLSFVNDSSMTVHSAYAEGVGVGASPRSIHASELPLWRDAEKTWNYVLPSIINQDNVLVIRETTPYPMDEPSSRWWKEEFENSKLGRGRGLAAFFPFWDSNLNVRPWDPSWTVDIEEHRLIDRYGKAGLALEHLAFRRLMLESDSAIRRNPDLFPVFYPFDDVTCWLTQGNGHIPLEAIRRQADHAVFEFEEPYTEFYPPNKDAIYIIGADPSGYGRDHSAFVVLEVWSGEWRVVASYSGNVDPIAYNRALFAAGIRYNRARIVVERNGPGVGSTTYLIDHHYPDIHYDRDRKPGIHVGNHERRLEMLVDALLDRLVIVDKHLLVQIQTYRSDKAVALAQRSSLLGHAEGSRRSRDHWDKVSALMVAVEGAKYMPGRTRRTAPEPGNVVPFTGWTMNAADRLAEAQAPRQNDQQFRFKMPRRR